MTLASAPPANGATNMDTPTTVMIMKIVRNIPPKNNITNAAAILSIPLLDIPKTSSFIYGKSSCIDVYY